jgi:hypothetical protein
MDVIVKTMFKNGINDGNVTIVCNNGQFDAHSFILKRMSAPIAAMIKYAKVGSGEIKNQSDYGGKTAIKFDCNINAARYMISLTYSALCKLDIKYTLSSLDVLDYFQAIDLYDINATTSNIGVNIILEGFQKSLTIENWPSRLKNIPDLPPFDKLKKVVFEFVKREILNPVYLSANEPFPDKDHPYYDRLIGLYKEKIVEYGNSNAKVSSASGILNHDPRLQLIQEELVERETKRRRLASKQ